ncbi:MAG TPA: hypothetical protein P5528_09160 [Steroidobacteraceae bacterium]|nr:hypothetical protein [Steroidobacteraceae bacterium]HRX89601.1 hypothetical protein [Steroidobacteraceae bacterium]
MFKQTGLLAAAAMAASFLYMGVAVADTPLLDQRQQNQRDRIVQGVRTGELTRTETRRLVAGQANLRRLEARAKSDGEVTARERVRLQREASQQSRRIARQKHDRQSRNR